MTFSVIALMMVLATPSNEPEVQFFDSDGVKLAYRIDGEGPPVILVHGLLANGNGFWRTPGTTGTLARNFRVISLDVRGHGQSGKPLESAAYGVELAEDVVRLLDHLQIERAHVVGYSMGGDIAVKLVTLHPDRLLSAVIGGAGWLRATSPTAAGYMQLADMLSALSPGDSIVEAMGGLPELTDEARKVVDSNDPQAIAALCRGALGLEASAGSLKSNTVPALAVLGENDEYRNDAEALTEVMSRLTMKFVPERNHAGTFGDPQFIHIIESWLTDHSGGVR